MSLDEVSDAAGDYGGPAPTRMTLMLRTLAWFLVAATFVFLINNYLNFWRGWPGFISLLAKAGLWDDNGTLVRAFDKHSGFALIQAATYGAAIAGAVFYVMKTRQRPLREDCRNFYRISGYLVRAAYWSVLLVGLADMLISFLRVEDLLASVVGEQLTSDLGRPQFRGIWVHFPLIILSFIISTFTRTLGFIWLALLVVVAELQIVIARFVFSYEQAFMGDLVRFWYGALFLFASAYTLTEEGHVRVDVLYAGFSRKTRALVNAWGSALLGLSLSAVIMAVGFWGKASIINSPVLSFEISQSGFGMYVKYLMALFLAVYAISMMIQFAGYMLSAVADYRNEPDGRETAGTMGGSGEEPAVQH